MDRETFHKIMREAINKVRRLYGDPLRTDALEEELYREIVEEPEEVKDADVPKV